MWNTWKRKSSMLSQILRLQDIREVLKWSTVWCHIKNNQLHSCCSKAAYSNVLSLLILNDSSIPFQSHTMIGLLYMTDLTRPSGPGKPDRAKGTDVRIKLERPQNHQSSSVSQLHPATNRNLIQFLATSLTLCMFVFSLNARRIPRDAALKLCNSTVAVLLHYGAIYVYCGVADVCASLPAELLALPAWLHPGSPSSG